MTRLKGFIACTVFVAGISATAAQAQTNRNSQSAGGENSGGYVAQDNQYDFALAYQIKAVTNRWQRKNPATPKKRLTSTRRYYGMDFSGAIDIFARHPGRSACRFTLKIRLSTQTCV